MKQMQVGARLWQCYLHFFVFDYLGFQTPVYLLTPWLFAIIPHISQLSLNLSHSGLMFTYRAPKSRALQISYLPAEDPAENMLNQLLALLTKASPILATLAKDKDTAQARSLQEYFCSSANAHWAVLLPKSPTQVQDPWAAEYKKVSSALLAIVFPAPHLGVVGQIIP